MKNICLGLTLSAAISASVTAATFNVPANFAGDTNCPLDKWIQANYAALHNWDSNTIIFPAGTFYTHGIKQGYNWNVQGSREGTTTLKIADNCMPAIGGEVFTLDDGPPRSPNFYHTSYFYARDLTLDCNFSQQKGLGCPSAVGGLNVSCQRKIRVERVTVINSGSIGREGFPILVRSKSRPELADQIVVSECRVPNYTGINRGDQSGYCTAISVVTRDPYWDTSSNTNAPYGRSSRAALIQSNVIGVATTPGVWFKGVGAGASFSENVTFSHNTIEHCEVGFGFDTGRNVGIRIENNRVTAISGMKIGSPNSAASFERYLIASNVFELYPPMLPGQSSFGVGLAGYVSDSEIVGNQFHYNSNKGVCHGVYSCLAFSPIAAPYHAGQNNRITVRNNTFTPKGRFANMLSKKGGSKVFGNNKNPTLVDR